MTDGMPLLESLSSFILSGTSFLPSMWCVAHAFLVRFTPQDWGGLSHAEWGYSRLPAADFPGALEESFGAAAALLHPGAGHRFHVHLPRLPGCLLYTWLVSGLADPYRTGQVHPCSVPRSQRGQVKGAGTVELGGYGGGWKSCPQCAVAVASPTGSMLGGLCAVAVGEPHCP